MPYLQEPAFGRRIRYARSDHTIPIPRPAYEWRLGMETACHACHVDRPADELQARVDAWYGQIKPQPALVAAVARADGVSEGTAAARLLVPRSGEPPLAAFVALSRLLVQYVTPDMPALERDIVDRLQHLAQSGDVDVQALALATLHLARGTDPEIRRFLARELRGLGARDGEIRSRWVWALKVRGDAYVARQDYESALASYERAREIEPGDPSIVRNLGVVYGRLRDYGSAVKLLRESLALRPNQPMVLVELAFALWRQGSVDAAVTTYRQAIALNPWEPAAYANLGLVYLQQGGSPQSAVDAFERAVELDPGLAAAHFGLADAYAKLGRLDQAAAVLERGLEFDPRNAAARRMLDALRHASDRRPR